MCGHAVKARFYAENPVPGFLPATGPVDHMVFGTAFDRDRLRVDTGAGEGDAVTPFYDPMIAKLIVHAPTRERGMVDLASVIRDSEVWSLTTNLAFLPALSTSEFAAGPVDTGFIARQGEALRGLSSPPRRCVWRAAALRARAWAYAGSRGPACRACGSTQRRTAHPLAPQRRRPDHRPCRLIKPSIRSLARSKRGTAAFMRGGNKDAATGKLPHLSKAGRPHNGARFRRPVSVGRRLLVRAAHPSKTHENLRGAL